MLRSLCATHLGDAYTLDYWRDIAKRIEDMGADSICIKDMAGLLTPYAAQELVTALKESTELPIDLHTHYTSGVASMTYLKQLEGRLRYHRYCNVSNRLWVPTSQLLRLW